MNKKGFTIVETIIALAVVSLVAIFASSITVISARETENNQNKLFATNLCNNSIVIFRSIDSYATLDELYSHFDSRISTALGLDLPPITNGETTIFLDKSWRQTQNENSNAKCTFVFKQESNLISLTVSVSDASGQGIHSASYYSANKEGV